MCELFNITFHENRHISAEERSKSPKILIVTPTRRFFSRKNPGDEIRAKTLPIGGSWVTQPSVAKVD
jgi:hypothetical protein